MCINIGSLQGQKEGADFGYPAKGRKYPQET